MRQVPRPRIALAHAPTGAHARRASGTACSADTRPPSETRAHAHSAQPSAQPAADWRARRQPANPRADALIASRRRVSRRGLGRASRATARRCGAPGALRAPTAGVVACFGRAVRVVAPACTPGHSAHVGVAGCSVSARRRRASERVPPAAKPPAAGHVGACSPTARQCLVADPAVPAAGVHALRSRSVQLFRFLRRDWPAQFWRITSARPPPDHWCNRDASPAARAERLRTHAPRRPFAITKRCRE
jgi:hypothetical protein